MDKKKMTVDRGLLDRIALFLSTFGNVPYLSGYNTEVRTIRKLIYDSFMENEAEDDGSEVYSVPIERIVKQCQSIRVKAKSPENAREVAAKLPEQFDWTIGEIQETVLQEIIVPFRPVKRVVKGNEQDD